MLFTANELKPVLIGTPAVRRPDESPNEDDMKAGAPSAALAPALWKTANEVPPNEWLVAGETFAAWISSRRVLTVAGVAAAAAAVLG